MKFMRSRFDKKLRKINIHILELDSRVKILEEKVKEMREGTVSDKASKYSTE
jgi:hypothetical protein